MKTIFALAALALAGCGKPAAPLPVLGQVPGFDLVSQNNTPFDRKSLEGSVWVADFIFTNCAGPCPRMSGQMRQVQQSVPASVKLVSFTVDPDRDTPDVLALYARRYKADPARWTFLTGETAKLDYLANDVFHLNRVDGSLYHSTRFVLVDRKGQIRGYYSSSDDDAFPRLMRDAKRLEADPS